MGQRLEYKINNWIVQMPGDEYQVQYTSVTGNQMGQVVYVSTTNTPQGTVMCAVPPGTMAQAGKFVK